MEEGSRGFRTILVTDRDLADDRARISVRYR